MDFFSIVMFLGLYYIRPQEWSALFFKLQPVKVAMLLAMIAMVLKYRQRSFLKDLFRTPHDWIILLYFIWLIGTAPDIRNTFSTVYSHLLFYLVTVQALSKVERIQHYLNWWTFFIVAVAALALAGEYGFDPMNSYDLTHGPRQQGRLVLNTSIFNNPNALGHSVVPAVVMLYFLLFWNRPVFMKIATIPVMFIPLYCIYMTLSKGAFIAGFATIVNAFTYRRPKSVQLLIFLMAFTIGFTGLKMLPRMQEMENAKGEEGIQGRVLAFQYGLTMLKTKPTGIGYNKFMKGFEQFHGFAKAPHSSYVQIGAELGYMGLCLFIGILYCCLRTLVTVKTTNIEDERVRRILFVLLISFMLSSWMVGWSYRATFFLMVAVIAAFHRQMLAKTEVELAEANLPLTEPELVLTVGGVETPLSKSANPSAKPGNGARATPKRFGQTEVEPEIVNPGIRWNRFGLMDIVLIILMTIATVQFWTYIMHHI